MSPVADAVVLDKIGISFGVGRHRVDALANVSATIRRGGISGIMGADGAGKTTLLRILAGILHPANGKAKIFGKVAARQIADYPNSIGYMPQKFGLYEDLSIMANLELYARLRGLDGNKKKERFKTLLDFTGLSPFKTRLAGNLSGGMKQKLGIACALLGNPDLLLLDEPGVGVDPRSRRELWHMVEELCKAGGMTVLWATSYMDEAAKCPWLMVMDKGKILFTGSPRDLAKQADGQVYKLDLGAHSAGQAHRDAMTEWTGRPGILDVMIQGDFLRLVLDRKDSGEAARSVISAGGKPADASIEDAYMALIGGIDKRPSPYARITGIADTGTAVKISANRLTKKFGDFTAAHDITFQVRAGEIIGLLGPNGAGKSTTFRMLCGLSRPTSGDCSVDGVDMLRSGSQARARLGYMAQKFSLYPDIKVRQNISIFADLYGLDKKQRQDRLPILSSALDLQNYLHETTEVLPPGLKQRLALLCATLHEPPVLFLDEPTSGVDVRTRRDFWKHISALTSIGTAVLVTTHFMEEAEYCDRIALIYRGTMIRFGTPAELKSIVKDSPNPTLEDAFIATIDEYDREHPL